MVDFLHCNEFCGVSSLIFDQSDLNSLYIGLENGKVIRMDLRNHQCINVCHCNSEIVSLALHNDYMLSMAYGKDLKAFDMRNSTVFMQQSFEEEVNCVSWSSDCTLACCDDSGVVSIVANDTIALSLSAHSNIATAVSYLSQNFLVSGGMDCTMCVWDCNNGEQVDKFKMSDDVIQSPSMIHDVQSNGNNIIAGTSCSEFLYFNFDPINGNIDCSLRLHGHTGHVSKVHFPFWSKNGDFAISVATDSFVCLWDLTDEFVLRDVNFTNAEKQIFDTDFIQQRWKHSDKPTAIATSSDKIFVADNSNTITAYSLS